MFIAPSGNNTLGISYTKCVGHPGSLSAAYEWFTYQTFATIIITKSTTLQLYIICAKVQSKMYTTSISSSSSTTEIANLYSCWTVYKQSSDIIERPEQKCRENREDTTISIRRASKRSVWKHSFYMWKQYTNQQKSTKFFAIWVWWWIHYYYGREEKGVLCAYYCNTIFITFYTAFWLANKSSFRAILMYWCRFYTRSFCIIEYLTVI